MGLTTNLKNVSIHHPPGTELTPEQQASVGPAHIIGEPSCAEKRDKMIEAHAHRGKLDPDAGELFISFEPGTRPGEFIVLVQYEGAYRDEWPPEMRGNLCMDGQNKLLEMVTDWLKEMYGPVAGTWCVKVEEMPCPQVPYRSRLIESLHKMGEVIEVEAQERHAPQSGSRAASRCAEERRNERREGKS